MLSRPLSENSKNALPYPTSTVRYQPIVRKYRELGLLISFPLIQFLSVNVPYQQNGSKSPTCRHQ